MLKKNVWGIYARRIDASLLYRMYLFIFAFPIVFSQVIYAQNVIKSDIYSKLNCCICKVPFDKCVCSEAKEMKAYIDALLESGMPEEEIFYKVAKKYSLNIILDEQIKSKIEERLIKEAGERYPRIVLEPVSFDFGRVSKKQGRISKIFKLSNTGNSDLILKNIKTYCPCALISLTVDRKKSPYFGTKGAPKGWRGKIKPGQSGELEVVLDLASPHVKSGKVIRDAAIISNDPVYPEVTIRIEADVGY